MPRESVAFFLFLLALLSAFALVKCSLESRVFLLLLPIDLFSHIARFHRWCFSNVQIRGQLSHRYFFSDQLFNLRYVIHLGRRRESNRFPFLKSTARSSDTVNIVLIQNGNIEINYMRHLEDVSAPCCDISRHQD